jgi:protein-tyrosine phosphatase
MLARVIRAIRLRLAVRRALAAARTGSLHAVSSRPVRRVLVLCYGNIYRSPFAAEALRAAVPSLEVRSAGFHRREGRPSPDAHVHMSGELGVDLSAHRSRVVTRDDLDWADLIVFMDRHNWAKLLELRAAPGKLVWLGALAPGDVEIPDPYGHGESEARAVIERLKACTAALADALRKA